MGNRSQIVGDTARVVVVVLLLVHALLQFRRADMLSSHYFLQKSIDDFGNAIQ